MQQASEFMANNIAPWVLELKPVVVAVDGEGATLEMPPNDMLYRSGQIVCGQALMALADTTMVIGLVSAFEGSKLLTTVDMNTSFMRPVANDVVVAQAQAVRLGRTLAFMRVTMHAKTSSKVISAATGTYAVLGEA